VEENQDEPVQPAIVGKPPFRFRVDIYWLPICIVFPTMVIEILVMRGLIEASGGDAYILRDAVIGLYGFGEMWIFYFLNLLGALAWGGALLVFLRDVYSHHRWVWRDFFLLSGELCCALVLYWVGGLLSRYLP